MKREDYNKLISLFSTDMSSGWELCSFETTKGYLFPWAKLCSKDTILLPSRFNSGLKYGISIDIFPLDRFEANSYEEARNISIAHYKEFNARFHVAHAYTAGAKGFLRLARKKAEYISARLKGIDAEKILVSYSIENQKNPGKYFVCTQTPVFCCFEGIWINETVSIEFEGEMFPAPKYYDEVLTSIYGDWRTPPPKDQQVTHHTFTAYWK